MGLGEEVAKGAASGVGSAAGGKAVDKVTNPDDKNPNLKWGFAHVKSIYAVQGHVYDTSEEALAAMKEHARIYRVPVSEYHIVRVKV